MTTALNYSTAHVIGRMQLPHSAHFELIRHALQRADQVQVILGSAFLAPSPVNPFSAEQRQQMLYAGLTQDESARVRFAWARDRYDQAKWTTDINQTVQAHHNACGGAGRPLLVGHDKDATSSYLQWFPNMDLDMSAPRHPGLGATALRAQLLDSQPGQQPSAALRENVPADVLDWLLHWRASAAGEYVASYHRAVQAYNAKWGRGPFETADALITCNEHTLLVRRGGDGDGVGIDQLALPGGFLNDNESPLDGALREAGEETRIIELGISKQLLRDCSVSQHRFAHPRRSPRGLLRTTVTRIQLPSMASLPEVQSSSDTNVALWLPNACRAAMEQEFFEDHANIIATVEGEL